MKKLLLIGVVVLAGCATSVPVKMSFPNVPEEFKNTCPALKEVNPTTQKLSDVVTVVSENYGTYQECKIQVDNWIEWYETQKKIFESVK